MNKTLYKILTCIILNKEMSQRELALQLGYSLGKVNAGIKSLKNEGYIDEHKGITAKTRELIEENKASNAIILAAGYGFRMVPINHQTNKALIEVKGEVLIERLIKQLHEAKVFDITIVVGYMKEQFEYLMDKYNVKLAINMNYSLSNSLHSLAKVKDRIDHSYIVPCDLYFEKNPFNSFELYSWYMISNEIQKSSFLKCHLDSLEYVKNNGNKLVGVAFINNEDKDMIVNRINDLVVEGNTHMYWEELLITQKKCLIGYKMIESSLVQEFNSFDDLQQFDSLSPTLKTEIIHIIQDSLDVDVEHIKNIVALKTGMTNRSFLFECLDKKYIMRIPGEGTDKLIDRAHERQVYDVISQLEISDKVLFFDKKSGYKLTEYIENTHNCDAGNLKEVERCIHFLRNFHLNKLTVNHSFNLFERLEYYEQLWNGKESIYKDYEETKRNIYVLKEFIDTQDKESVLTHMDAVCDNFILFNVDGKEVIRLIDWEYASMQDPHVDIAMFAIYALYSKEQVDQLINMYFENKCDCYVRIKIYAYLAVCGLLWSNWCEYKYFLGVEFGEYSIAQYRYAKEYFKIAQEELSKVEELCIQ